MFSRLESSKSDWELHSTRTSQSWSDLEAKGHLLYFPVCHSLVPSPWLFLAWGGWQVCGLWKKAGSLKHSCNWKLWEATGQSGRIVSGQEVDFSWHQLWVQEPLRAWPALGLHLRSLWIPWPNQLAWYHSVGLGKVDPPVSKSTRQVGKATVKYGCWVEQDVGTPNMWWPCLRPIKT